MIRNNIQDILPLLPLQKTMLNNSIINRDVELYKEINCYLIEKQIDEEKIKIAWEYVIKNNEVLRTVFRWNGLSEPVQIILCEKECNYTVVNFFENCATGFFKYVEEVCSKLLKKEFDLEKDLFYITLLKRSDDCAVLVVMNHHILFDGWSNAMMLEEFYQYYCDLINNRAVSIRQRKAYKDCVRQNVLEMGKCNTGFWNEYLSKYIKRDKHLLKPDKRDKNKAIAGFSFNEEVLNRLRRQAADNRMSIVVYFYTAWAILLYIYYGDTDVVFGATFSGRPDNMTSCMSLLINTFPVIVHIDGSTNIQKKLQELQDIINSIQENRNVSLFEFYKKNKQFDVVSYDSIVVIQNYPVNNILLTNEYTPVSIYKRYYKSEIDLNMSIQFFAGIQFELEYNIDKYTNLDIAGISKMYGDILENILCADDVADIERMLSKKVEVKKIEFKEFELDEVF